MRQPQRQHPIFSPVALFSTLLLGGGLLIYVLLTGGRAFSPGDLSAVSSVDESGISESPEGFESHAEFQDDCSQCHTPWQGVSALRCERCHTNVGQQREANSGLHGQLDVGEDCAACHTEHQGASFDLLAQPAADFEHSQTGFTLVRHQTDYNDMNLRCTGCHNEQTEFPARAASCIDCHLMEATAFMIAHQDNFGIACISCHDGEDTLARFEIGEHPDTFPLVSGHDGPDCAACHSGANDLQALAAAPTNCVACHAPPDNHIGLFPDDCAACHSIEGFVPADVDPSLFDHAATGFTLENHQTNFDGQPFACADCHRTGDFAFADSDCVACHQPAEPAFMTEHIEQFGQSCTGCHDGSGRLTNFDHAIVFPLTGQHATLACASCHAGQHFQGTPTECAGCHAEPPIHAGLFGLRCENCHMTDGWQPARLSQHTFPLDHESASQISCDTCHQASFVEYTCAACHDPGEMADEHGDEGIFMPELAECASCHPTGIEDETEDRVDDD